MCNKLFNFQLFYLLSVVCKTTPKNTQLIILTEKNLSDFISDNQPGPPTNVVALPHSSSSILISWSPPVGNYRIAAYVVHYQKLGSDTEKQHVVGNATHSYKIPELYGYTNYSLYVTAITKMLGRKSKTIVQRTLQGSKSFVEMFWL